MADIIAMFSRWAKSGLSKMLSWASSSLDVQASSSMEVPSIAQRSAMDDFQRIMRMLPRIKVVLEDADDREILDRSVDLWLSELRLLAYDIDDIVDEYEYEVLRAQMEARVSKVANHRGKHKRGDEDHHHKGEQEEGYNILASSSSQVPSISDGMAEKLREIRERLDEIERDRKALRLREEDGVRQLVDARRPQPTSSLVDESNIFGREGDKEKIIELLLSDSEFSSNNPVRNKITILPIIGMGGLGKTTLAQLIYNDPKIRHHFDHQAWIYVSEDFDIVRLTAEIYRSITNRPYMIEMGLNCLQEFIKDELMLYKRTFLVLDDVWIMDQCLWESLQVPFHGDGIVNILITTRSKKVADVMGTIKPFCLDILSTEASWRLFQQCALCDDESLMRIGHKIVKKCGGLPLAIRLLGSHLRFERDEDKWMNNLESDIWDFDTGKNEILPALRLSYQRMPVHLKPCFRYCSMFPRNSKLNKNRLAWLWMAQGYIQPKTANKTMEKIGIEYFDELLERSLLQPTEFKNFFKMHDLIFDMAVSISGKEFNAMKLEDGKQNEFISNNVRHLVVYDQRTHNGAQEDNLVYPFPNKNVPLHSIFYHGRNIFDEFQLSYSTHLRTLHISFQNYDSTTLKFPRLTASVKHLRYLYMGNATSRFFHFKEKVAHLSLFNSFHGMYNMQVLDLFDCNQPLLLPTSINNLINLRHLILPYYSFMPRGISKLTSLQTLKYVIVKEGSHECGALGEVEGLESLTGSCRICNIYYAIDVEGVKKANINKKKHIQRLCLDWSIKDDSDFSFDVDISFDDEGREVEQSVELAEAVLEALRPHNSLRELEIYNYPGIRFPLWLGDPLYSKLKDITLHGCNKWNVSYGVLDRDLPCLQSISIISCAELKIVTVQSSSLRSLLIQDCFELSTLLGLCNLHMLEKLEIKKCYNLLISAEERLPPKLHSVCFEDCWNFASIIGLQCLHSLEELKLKRCPKLQLSLDEQLSIMPGVVKVIDCPGLREWCQRYRFEFIQEVSNIKELAIQGYKEIEVSYGSRNLMSLKSLYIHNFFEDEFPEVEWIPCSLNTLHLMSCHWLKFIPPYQNLSALKLLKIWRCGDVKYLPGLQMMGSLEKLEIIDCPQFILSPNQRFPTKLQFLLIRNCTRLMWLPGLQKLFSLRDLKLYECDELMLPPLEQLPFMQKVQLEIINCSKLGEWCRRYNISYNNQDSSKALFARSSQQIKLWLDEASVLFEKICILDYDEADLETEKWPAFRLLGFYVCSCVHLKTIKFGDTFTRLKKLRIWNCSHLEVIYELSKLTSLQEMDISNCPNLQYMIPPPLTKPSNRRIRLSINICSKLKPCISNSASWEFLKISKCPKLRLDDKLLQYPPPNIEIHACPQLQEWCQKNHFVYFQD